MTCQGTLWVCLERLARDTLLGVFFHYPKGRTSAFG